MRGDDFLAKKRQGQAAITDLFIAVAVFIILITITTLIWNLYNVRLDARIDYDNMVMKGYHITDTLVKHPGHPNIWETYMEENISYLLNKTILFGLAEQDHVISAEKLTVFINLTNTNYTQVKKKFTMLPYELYVVMKDINGTPLVFAGKIPQGKYAVNIARLVYYQRKTNTLEVTIWR
jgi:hypothetical protein